MSATKLNHRYPASLNPSACSSPATKFVGIGQTRRLRLILRPPTTPSNDVSCLVPLRVAHSADLGDLFVEAQALAETHRREEEARRIAAEIARAKFAAD